MWVLGTINGARGGAVVEALRYIYFNKQAYEVCNFK
jgi:hypothetical protein